MSIPYRTRSFLKRLGVFLLVAAVVAAIVLVCWLAWLDRFVVYTRDRGAVLDFNRSTEHLSGQIVMPPQKGETITLVRDDGSDIQEEKKELTQIIGYYITASELETDFTTVLDQLRALPEGTPVMIDLKSIYGNFFYSSAVSENRNSDLDIAAMDDLISEMNSGKYYTIARVPALCDRLYGLEHVSDGLPVAAGYLWMDSNGCYWLNPASDGTISYLAKIANELRGLGFDEVVFTDYYFPNADSIVFKGDKAQTLADTAQTLVKSCATDYFTVSFAAQTEFTPPTGRSRIYLNDAVAADAKKLAEALGFENPAARVVFITNIHDTRFDDYSVLRPISDAG